MSISVVIPTYTVDDYLEVMAYNAARGYKEKIPDCELIIVEDGGRKSPALLDIADMYFYHPQNIGFTKNLNVGWYLSSGDYVFLVNSDTYIDEGDYMDLCIPGKVTSPFMAGHERGENFLNGAFFVVPKEVARERGVLDEQFKTYYSDDDYYQRVMDIFEEVDTVSIRHAFGASIGHNSIEWRDKETERDRELFTKKYAHLIEVDK